MALLAAPVKFAPLISEGTCSGRPARVYLCHMAEALVPIFRAEDAAKCAEWYVRWGFEVVGEHRFADGLPLYLFLERAGVQLHLSEHTGDARPGSLAYFWVDDVDAIAAELNAEIHEQPWAREIKLTDPDGNRLRVATRPADQ